MVVSYPSEVFDLHTDTPRVEPWLTVLPKPRSKFILHNESRYSLLFGPPEAILLTATC